MRHFSPVAVMSPLPVASMATTRPMVPSSRFSSLCETYTVAPSMTGETLMPRLLRWNSQTFLPVRACIA